MTGGSEFQEMALQNHPENPPTFSTGHQCCTFFLFCFVLFFAIPHWWTPKTNEPMELWDFYDITYEQINLSVCSLSSFERKQAAEVGLRCPVICGKNTEAL